MIKTVPANGPHRMRNARFSQYPFVQGAVSGFTALPMPNTANAYGPAWRQSLNYDQTGNLPPPVPTPQTSLYHWPSRVVQGSWAGPLAGPSPAKIRRKVEKFRGKVEAGKKCGVWPFATQRICEKKLAKWEARLAEIEGAQAGMQDVVQATSPEASAAAIQQAAAANVAAVQGSANTLAYLAAGGVILASVVFAGIVLLTGGKGRRR